MSGSLWPFPVPLNAWCALGTSAGEVTGGGYARQQVILGVMANDPTGLANTTTIEWPRATVDWGTVTTVTLYDAPAGGNVVLTGSCAPLEIDAWDRPRIQAGELYSDATTTYAVTWGGVAPFGLWRYGTGPILTATLGLTFAPVMLCSAGAWAPPGPFAKAA